MAGPSQNLVMLLRGHRGNCCTEIRPKPAAAILQIVSGVRLCDDAGTVEVKISAGMFESGLFTAGNGVCAHKTLSGFVAQLSLDSLFDTPGIRDQHSVGRRRDDAIHGFRDVVDRKADDDNGIICDHDVLDTVGMVVKETCIDGRLQSLWIPPDSGHTAVFETFSDSGRDRSTDQTDTMNHDVRIERLLRHPRDNKPVPRSPQTGESKLRGWQ